MKAIDQHALCLGTLFTNLQTLEFLLRLFLYKKRSRPHISFVRGQNLTGLRVGKVLPENAVTDYDSLGKLIRRYNATAVGKVHGLKITDDLVSLRDALAQGRVFVPKTGLPLQLLKFTKPRGKTVRVEFAAALSLDWLEKQSTRVLAEITKVRAAMGSGRRYHRA